LKAVITAKGGQFASTLFGGIKREQGDALPGGVGMGGSPGHIPVPCAPETLKCAEKRKWGVRESHAGDLELSGGGRLSDEGGRGSRESKEFASGEHQDILP
jgi:hypothetical protein